jgi:ankyrin repeat protein
MERDQSVLAEFIDAAVKDPTKAIRLLDANPALRSARWIHDETALHFFAVEGYTDAVKLLGQLGFDPNLPNEFGDAPLIDVAVLGNDTIAELLLDMGANPNAQSDTRDNVLNCAVRSGNARLVQLLIERGARTDYATELGESIFDALPNKPAKRAAIEEVLQKYGIM